MPVDPAEGDFLVSFGVARVVVRVGGGGRGGAAAVILGARLKW